MISLTGKFVFSVLLALSQYVVPYTEEQKAEILKGYEEEGIELADWEIKALNFEPLNIYELVAISGDETQVAQYLRTACIRIISAAQSQDNIDQGIFEALDFGLLRALVSPQELVDLQTRVRTDEQEIQLPRSIDYLERACDLKYSIDAIEKIALYENPLNLFEATPENAERLFTTPLSFGPSVGEMEDEQFPVTSFSFPQVDVPPFYEGAMREVIEYYGKIYFELPQIDSKDDLPYLPEQSLVFDGNGQLIGEYSATEYSQVHSEVIRRNKRVLTKDSSDIPEKLKQALVSVEDSDFYNHLGVDLRGAMRAAQSSGSGDVQGASTITMQLVKNLILYEDVFLEHVEGSRSLIRKLQEYILVRQIESVLTKDEILEWYFNTIDYGRGVQGIVLATKVYLGKELTELNPDEITKDLSGVAFLAGLPKAPNGLDPHKDYDRAFRRRNRVLTDMRREDYITEEQFDEASISVLQTLPSNTEENIDGYSMHYVNAVQSQVRDFATRAGMDAYLGYEVSTPINHEYQKWTVEALQRGLLKYERGQTGSRALTVKPHEDQLPNIREQVEALAEERGESTISVFKDVLSTVENRYPDASQFELGVILSDTKMGLVDGTQVNRQNEDQPANLKKEDVDGRKSNLQVWDVVMLQPFKKSDGGTFYKIASYTKVQGGVVVIDNATGEVLATAGRFSVGAGGRYKGSGGNWAFTSLRQPGSTAKPFVYLHAMNKGILPGQSISNGDISFPAIRKAGTGYNQCDPKTWRDSGESAYYTLYNGLVQSKNRLILNAFSRSAGVEEWQNPGDHSRDLEDNLDELALTYQSFGMYKDRDFFCYPVILGAHESRVFEIAGAYATLARGGGFIAPHTISNLKWVAKNKSLPNPLNQRDEDQMTQAAIDEALMHKTTNIFRLKEMLKDVVQKGTARSISDSSWSSQVAGKTGTVEVCERGKGCKNTDAWFIGFNEEVTVAVWVGYKEQDNLGQGNHGSDIALPIFKDFMDNYYETYPENLSNGLNDTVPSNLVSVNIESNTGFLIDNNFRNDFAFYTGLGTSSLDQFTTAIYVTEDERRNLPTYARNNSAMGFFYTQLTNSKKEELRQRVLDSLGGQTNSSAYDTWNRNQSVCSPWFYLNESGQTTWDQTFRRYNNRPARAERERINNACFYIVNNARPAAPVELSVSNTQMRDYFIRNY